MKSLPSAEKFKHLKTSNIYPTKEEKISCGKTLRG